MLISNGPILSTLGRHLGAFKKDIKWQLKYHYSGLMLMIQHSSKNETSDNFWETHEYLNVLQVLFHGNFICSSENLLLPPSGSFSYHSKWLLFLFAYTIIKFSLHCTCYDIKHTFFYISDYVRNLEITKFYLLFMYLA